MHPFPLTYSEILRMARKWLLTRKNAARIARKSGFRVGRVVSAAASVVFTRLAIRLDFLETPFNYTPPVFFETEKTLPFNFLMSTARSAEENEVDAGWHEVWAACGLSSGVPGGGDTQRRPEYPATFRLRAFAYDLATEEVQRAVTLGEWFYEAEPRDVWYADNGSPVYTPNYAYAHGAGVIYVDDGEFVRFGVTITTLNDSTDVIDYELGGFVLAHGYTVYHSWIRKLD